MVNLVVDDIDVVLEKARAAGVEPLGRDDGDEHGRFAWLLDPEDVKVELWQPPAEKASA
jgi:predicted enzyme related to lactoylglutathione lyase